MLAFKGSLSFSPFFLSSSARDNLPAASQLGQDPSTGVSTYYRAFLTNTQSFFNTVLFKSPLEVFSDSFHSQDQCSSSSSFARS